ncbi:MAG: glutamate--tRNA ligase [bacterium]
MVRVRIAPSPTGPLHIGTARSALFNYLFAKQNKGKFILRVDDTDKERSEDKYLKNLTVGLKDLGITWDEGIEMGGEFGPYKQSKRGEIYEKYLQQLLEENKAYYCNCSKEKLDEARKKQIAEGKAQIYSGLCRDKNINKEEFPESVIRLKVDDKDVTFSDLIKGQQTIATKEIGDMVIAKSTKEVLYNFASVVDDEEMKISHVIRGEDHLSNTPKQILIMEALEFSVPHFGHIPLILNKDKSKLSKRKNKVSISDYLQEGFLPEALINYMVLLGWNPKNTEEFFTLEELGKEFNLTKVNKSGAIFDLERLRFFNAHYIKEMNLSKLTEMCLPYLIKKKLIAQPDSIENNKLENIIKIEQSRIEILSEVGDDVMFLFSDHLTYDPRFFLWKDMTKEDVIHGLEYMLKLLDSYEEKDFNNDFLQKNVVDRLKADTENIGQVLWPLRIALSGQKQSPSPFEIMEVYGKKESLKRVTAGIDLAKTL